jgi:hypothetical protein
MSEVPRLQWMQGETFTDDDTRNAAIARRRCDSWRSASRGRWILLVEDVFPLALMLEGIVQSLGCHVAGRPETFADATRQARALEFDAAILDTELWGESVYPVAEILRARDIPFLFAARPLAHWRGYPTVSKPYRTEAIGRALAALPHASRLHRVPCPAR